MRHSSDVKIPSPASTSVASHIESVHRIKSLLFITKMSRLGSEDQVVLLPIIASDDNSEG